MLEKKNLFIHFLKKSEYDFYYEKGFYQVNISKNYYLDKKKEIILSYIDACCKYFVKLVVKFKKTKKQK